MKNFKGAVKVGLRSRDTNEIIAVYPEEVEGDLKEIEDRVRFWFYQQSCGAEEVLRNSYVDIITEDGGKAR